jgi:hypothetical protein
MAYIKVVKEPICAIHAHTYLKDEEPTPKECTEDNHDGSFEPVASIMSCLGTIMVYSFGPWEWHHWTIVHNHEQCTSNCDRCSNDLYLAPALLYYYLLNPD